MDVTSAPATEVVTDWDFTFIGGVKFTLVVNDNDKVVTTSGGDLTIQHFVDCTLVEEISITKANLLYISKRKRTVTIYPAGQSPLELALAELNARNK